MRKDGDWERQGGWSVLIEAPHTLCGLAHRELSTSLALSASLSRRQQPFWLLRVSRLL